MKRAQALRLLLALLLAAVAVVTGGLSFQRKVASFQPIGFAAEVPGGFARVTRVDDPATALRRRRPDPARRRRRDRRRVRPRPRISRATRRAI